MTQLHKPVLLLLACLLLVLLSGCGSSSAPTTPPNGFLYAANTFRPGSMAGFTVTTGSLGHISGSPFVTNSNAPYTLAAVSTKFVYAGVPASSKGGVITRILGRTLSGSVTGGIMLMPIKRDHTLDTPQMFASGTDDYDPIAVTPNDNFLYAADLTTNHLPAFSIDSSKGTLTAIGPPGGVAVGPDPFNVVVDPQGKFVFVANSDFTAPSNHGSVSVFSINSDGTLAVVSGSPFLIGSGTAHPSALAVSPDSKVLFVASLDNMVYVENIGVDGTLTAIACPSLQAGLPSPCALPPGSTPVSIAVSADGGNSVYTGNAGTGTISFLLNCVQNQTPGGCLDAKNGNLLGVPLVFQGNTNVGGAVGVAMPDPTSVAATSTSTATGPGHFLYVTDYDHGTITVFAVTSTGSCTTWPATSSCSPVPGTLTQSGSAVNTGGVNPFGLAFAH